MIKSIKSVKVENRRVVVRVGFDVPLKLNSHTEEYEVADENRIKDALPTLKYLIENKAKIVIISHLDRPEGMWLKEKSMWPVAQVLGRLLNYKVVKVSSNQLPNYPAAHINFLDADIRQNGFAELSRKLNPGDILFLENMRFYKGEEENSEEFVNALAEFGDLFVNEAFSVAHRKEASTYGIAQKLPSYAGFSLTKEIEALNKIIKHPNQPMVVVIGGAKIADKIDTIHKLADLAELVLVGGALANSFMKAKGYEIGKSKFSDLSLAKELLRNYKEKIVLPVDVVVGKSTEDHPRCVSIDKVRPGDTIFDVGPETIRKYSAMVKKAKTLVWNGPLGLIEYPKFAFGSLSVARMFAARAKGKAYGVVGGGETVEVVDQAKVSEFIDHVSTGGGAMLEFLAGKSLPAIKVLEK